MSTFVADDDTAARARVAAVALLDAGDSAVAEGLKLPVENYRIVSGAYGWWRLVNRSARAVLLLIDQGFGAPETAPLMRNLFNHSFALHWMIDNGEPAVDAVISAGANAQDKMLKVLETTGWQVAAQYRQAVAQRAPEPARTAAEADLHKKLVHEISKVRDLFERYGSAELYPVYSHLSALSHTSVDTASAYLEQLDDGTLQIRPSAARLDNDHAYVIHLAIALIQAGHVFSPLLDGDPLRGALDQAITDLGLEGTQIVPARTR